MSDTVNHLVNQLRKSSWFKSQGPILCGQVYSEAHGQDMLEQRFKVSNGSYVDEADVPYGSFVRIEQFNTKESWCIVLSTPYDDGEEPPVPVFKERCKSTKNLNKYICSSTECQTIVPVGTEADSGANVWESQVDAIDDKHAVKTTVTVVTVNTVEDCGWDEVLNEDIHYTEMLVNVKPVTCGWVSGTTDMWVGTDPWVGTSAWSEGSGTFVTYEKIRCGWWIVRSETLNFGTKQSYNESRNYYWPPVLEALNFASVWNAEDYPKGADEHDYIVKLVTNVHMKDAYNGPCKARVIVSYMSTPPETIPTQLITDAVSYSGIATSFSLPTCLHFQLNFTEVTGPDHRVYENESLTSLYEATEFTDWPDQVIAEMDVRAYKGNFVVRKIIIDKPS